MDDNGPRDVLRDGALKASIWRNEGEKGPFYSTTLARTYKVEGTDELRDSHNFAGTELLRVSELARKAYDRTQELRREDRAPDNAGPDREARREAFQERRGQAQTQSQRQEPQH